MTGVASGIASSGLRPITYTIAPFNTTRCLEQIKLDVCYPNLPVIIVGTGAGLSYANLGATHHSLEDIGLLRLLPNIKILCPSDPNEVKKLLKGGVYNSNMEHEACGVGLVASIDGKKSRKIVEYGIEALKSVWHRGAVDADGKTGDGAGIHIEIPSDFFIEKIELTGHSHNNSEICVGMVFLPRNDYNAQEKSRTIVETELTKNDFSI